MPRRPLATWILFSALLLGAGAAAGSDVYVVRFDTSNSSVPLPPCGYLFYRDELIFHNSGATDASVALLGVSNGAAADPQMLAVPVGRTRSSEGGCDGCAVTGTWAPAPQPSLWVAHLDVPDEVQTVSRLLVLASQPVTCNGFPAKPTRTYAGISMPVVRSLTPPGVPQIHLGTDIGGDAGGLADDGRTNVGIYNGGTVAASASVELRRACDGDFLQSKSVLIPANTIVQVGGFSEVFVGCGQLDTGTFETYVVVTVDQPSFSYSITLSNERLPLLPVSSSP